MNGRRVFAGTILVALSACVDPTQPAPFEPPAYHVTKNACRGDDALIVWGVGKVPDRNGNGLVCQSVTKKNSLYDDHWHSETK